MSWERGENLLASGKFKGDNPKWGSFGTDRRHFSPLWILWKIAGLAFRKPFDI
jgi:hypothetical protein